MKKLFPRTLAILLAAGCLMGAGNGTAESGNIAAASDEAATLVQTATPVVAVTTDEDVEEDTALPAGTETVVPVLLYHHLAEDMSGGGMTVTTAQFTDQLNALKLAGYNTITTVDLIAYVDEGVALPENPVWITFDDGYESNLSIGAPLLAARDMQATLFAIGVTDGATTYRDTDTAITPHYAYTDVNPWITQGTMELQSHGYDIHQMLELDGEDSSMGAIMLPNESLFDYIDRITADVSRSITDIEAATNVKVTALAYPYGKHNGVTEGIMQQLGLRITTTVEEVANVVIVGDATSLYAMGRQFVTDDQSGADLIVAIREKVAQAS